MNEQTQKHTPGPWFNRDNESIRCSDEDNSIVCFIALSHASCATRKSDADLIAAAPDLLAACQRVANIADWDGYNIDPIHFKEALYELRETARAAIAKARGE
jgi:hypothetical protein